MKKFIFLVSLILLVVFAAQISAEQTSEKSKSETIETNLIIGVNSNNEGLRISAAYYLGEMKSEKAVIPLMRMLREEKSDAARIMAALSLIKIEDPQGLFLVKRTATFNEYARVRNLSGHFYNAYLLKKYLEQNPEKAEYIAGF
ncbi:MAG: hypothetical protein A2V66_01345 [Ignavibacteria bacterium RBG_13_36_8]|nr:MAG: hypothetical protein A2V66_01345 [Ignavibacteria bacterium RBG_13_36_8]